MIYKYHSGTVNISISKTHRNSNGKFFYLLTIFARIESLQECSFETLLYRTIFCYFCSVFEIYIYSQVSSILLLIRFHISKDNYTYFLQESFQFQYYKVYIFFLLMSRVLFYKKDPLGNLRIPFKSSLGFHYNCPSIIIICLPFGACALHILFSFIIRGQLDASLNTSYHAYVHKDIHL